MTQSEWSEPDESLKTLKDIKLGPAGRTEETLNTERVLKKWIKEEGIKWAKHHEGYLEGSDLALVNGFVKYFFNITEEDLKDE